MKKAVKFMVVPAIAAASLFAGKGLAQEQPSQISPAPRAFAQMAPKIDKATAAWPSKEAKKETYSLSKGDTINLASQRPDATLRIFSSKGITIKGLTIFSKKDDGYLNGKLEYIDPASGKMTGIIIHITPNRRAAQNAEVYFAEDQVEHALKIKKKPVKESRQKGFEAFTRDRLSIKASAFINEFATPFAGIGASYCFYRWGCNADWSLLVEAAVATTLVPEYWGGAVGGKTDGSRSGTIVVRDITVPATKTLFIEVPSIALRYSYSHFFASVGASMGMIRSFGKGADITYSFTGGVGREISSVSTTFDVKQTFIAFTGGVGGNLGPKLRNIAVMVFAQVNFLLKIDHPLGLQYKTRYEFKDSDFSERPYKYANGVSDDNNGVRGKFGITIFIPLTYSKN